MTAPIFHFKTKLLVFPGQAAWHYVELPQKGGKTIDKYFSDLKRGWGSLRVRATVGATSWDTSIFPLGKKGPYMLPVKASVRKKEFLKAGKMVNYSIEIKM